VGGTKLDSSPYPLPLRAEALKGEALVPSHQRRGGKVSAPEPDGKERGNHNRFLQSQLAWVHDARRI
jgi:hypothetical protein